MKLRTIFSRAAFEIGLFSLVINLLILVQPLYLLQIYDRVLVSASYDTLVYITLIALVAYAALGLLEAARSIYASRVANRMDAALASNALYVSMNTVNATSGDVRPVQDLAAVRGFFNSKTIFFLFDLPFAPIFLILLYFIHPMLFFVTLGGAIVLVLIVLANQFSTRRLLSDQQGSQNRSLSLAQTFTRNAETIRALGMSGNVIERWGHEVAQGMTANDVFQTRNALFAGFSRFVRMGLQIAILAIGAYYVIIGELTAGMIFASSIISGRALQPLDQIISAWRNIQTSWTSFKRVVALDNMELEQKKNDVRLPTPSGAIRAENLVYMLPHAPPGSDPLIKRLNFAIRSGDCVGIVGNSGAGKSTLARLLVGAIRPTQGNVSYDGADINQWMETDRGRHVGYVNQEVQFFPGTIAENIARFEPEFDEKAVIEAARKAGAHDVIVSRTKGYATYLGADGEKLSGGEMQRIALARALYGDPQIIVLDEPNANLDSDGERALQACIAAARQARRTIVLITHHKPLAAFCDKLLVIHDGAMQLYGPSKQVLEKLQGGPVNPPGKG